MRSDWRWVLFTGSRFPSWKDGRGRKKVFIRSFKDSDDTEKKFILYIKYIYNRDSDLVGRSSPSLCPCPDENKWLLPLRSHRCKRGRRTGVSGSILSLDGRYLTSGKRLTRREPKTSERPSVVKGKFSIFIVDRQLGFNGKGVSITTVCRYESLYCVYPINGFFFFYVRH